MVTNQVLMCSCGYTITPPFNKLKEIHEAKCGGQSRLKLNQWSLITLTNNEPPATAETA